MKILVVEDDNDYKLFLTAALVRWGYEVVSASDGVEAWKLLKKEAIGLVICDWMMPNMDGVELCRRIRAANFHRYIYFVLLTAKSGKTDLIQGMKFGADDTTRVHGEITARGDLATNGGSLFADAGAHTRPAHISGIIDKRNRHEAALITQRS